MVRPRPGGATTAVTHEHRQPSCGSAAGAQSKRGSRPSYFSLPHVSPLDLYIRLYYYPYSSLHSSRVQHTPSKLKSSNIPRAQPLAVYDPVYTSLLLHLPSTWPFQLRIEDNIPNTTHSRRPTSHHGRKSKSPLTRSPLRLPTSLLYLLSPRSPHSCTCTIAIFHISWLPTTTDPCIPPTQPSHLASSQMNSDLPTYPYLLAQSCL